MLKSKIITNLSFWNDIINDKNKRFYNFGLTYIAEQIKHPELWLKAARKKTMKDVHRDLETYRTLFI